jgi:serine/threonine-protein kinase HipA
MVLSGNGDAHLKNWALYYPARLSTRLAPVYDLVATVAYSNLDRSALRWCEPAEPSIERPQRLAEVTIDDLIVVAAWAGADTARAMRDATTFAATVREAWPQVEATAPPFVRHAITEHLAAAAL